jgi:zinc transport system ATP-binding protein
MNYTELRPGLTTHPIQSKEPLIRLTNVCMEWDRREILNDINLTVSKGDFIAITGPNGGGKTTMLRIILKLLKPGNGYVEYFGPDGLTTDRLPIGYLPQKNMIDAKFPMTVKEVLASGLLASKDLSKEQRNERIAEILDTIDLKKHSEQTIGNLSGGQLQRALLGRALISRPSILILDEPLNYIDKDFEQKLYSLIASLAHTTTILLVSHEMSVISGMANRHLIVDHTIHECTAQHHFIPSPCK